MANDRDHSDEEFDEEMTDEENFPDDFSDSDPTWPDDSETDEEVLPAPTARNAPTTNESTQGTSNYGYIILIVGAVVVSLLPVWFQSPNGFTLLKQSLQGNDNANNVNCKSALGKNEILFTKDELAKFSTKPKILLGFLGVVYDVTGGQYYHPDGSYHFFAGIDGTRGFLTGEFTPDELRDDISDLDQSYFNGIDTWLNLYKEKYERVGLLIGAYYDSNGCETRTLHHVLKRFEQSKESEGEDKAELEKYPPCNSEWSANDKRGRVWCTTLSGGINRSWTGRPRQLYVLGSKSWRCACVEDDQTVSEEDWCDKKPDDKTPPTQPKSRNSGVKYAPGEQRSNCLFKHYLNCDPTATECPFQD